MNRTEYIGKLNALYVGDKNCLEELITAYVEKNKEIERLNNIINELEEYLSKIDDYLYNDTKNSIEKITIITRIEELVFWLGQYRSQHIEGE